jgi:hypothetical protein
VWMVPVPCACTRVEDNAVGLTYLKCKISRGT